MEFQFCHKKYLFIDSMILNVDMGDLTFISCAVLQSIHPYFNCRGGGGTKSNIVAETPKFYK